MSAYAIPRRFFESNILTRTMDAYHNHSPWIEEAIFHRLCTAKQIYYEFTPEGEVMGYMGVTPFYFAGRKIAYVEITTVYDEYKGLGVSKLLKKQLVPGYDGILSRTQNPRVLASTLAVCKNVAPITCKPNVIEKALVAKWCTIHNIKYEQDTFVCRGVYNGQMLTGFLQTGRTEHERALYSLINPEKGDAIFLVSLFKRETPYGDLGFAYRCGEQQEFGYVVS